MTAEDLSIEGTAPVQSVDRALRLVEILAGREAAGVTELAAVLGVHKSTASRLLSTLERHGIVEQDPGRGSYRLGAALAFLAGAVTGRVRLFQASHATAERLAHEVGETVTLAVLEGDRLVTVDHIAPGPAPVPPDWPDLTLPVHATASGKVLLAWLPEHDIRRLLGHPLLRYTSATVVDPDELAEELFGVREQGWALAMEEHSPGLNAVSAPIFDRDGAPIAALTIVGPSSRLGPERLEHVAVLTALRATEVSTRLGYRGRPEA
ncbi:MAG: IclR family transcriptional regulator [Acidimicrobiaceae bacterium]|nr:IclR family transcriptional regulator [Acidimicrobiaceae bacterium]MBO0748465.1 IclR family transcriptional regulator [Acidimicrobiaceae bacterium]